MLAPLIKVPKLELLEGIIRLNMTPTPVFIFQLTVYIVPMGLEPLVFPFHKTKAVLSYLSAVVADNFSNTTVSHETEPESLRADEPNKWWASNSENIRATRDQVEVKGPGRMYIRGAGDGARYAGQWDFDLRFEMLEARSGLPVSIQGKFLRATTGENRDRWILEPQ